MAVIRDEQVGAHLRHIDLHADQSVSVTWKVVKSDALAEIERSLVKGLPVSEVWSVYGASLLIYSHSQSKLEVMLQIDTNIRARGHRPES